MSEAWRFGGECQRAAPPVDRPEPLLPEPLLPLEDPLLPAVPVPEPMRCDAPVPEPASPVRFAALPALRGPDAALAALRTVVPKVAPVLEEPMLEEEPPPEFRPVPDPAVEPLLVLDDELCAIA